MYTKYNNQQKYKGLQGKSVARRHYRSPLAR